MPSHDLMVCRPACPDAQPDILTPPLQLYFQSDLTLVRSWYLSGTNYSRTLEHWLKLQDKNTKGEEA